MSINNRDLRIFIRTKPPHPIPLPMGRGEKADVTAVTYGINVYHAKTAAGITA
jgi:hypothetical protein